MENRIKELRKKAGLSAAELGRILASGRSTITKLERGEMRLTTDWMGRIASALRCSPEELIAGNHPGSVPVECIVAAAFSDQAPIDFMLSEPYQRVAAPPRLPDAEECFAAEVADDSADRLYPPGSTLFVRRVEYLEGRLRAGQKVVVRRFITDRRDGRTMEVLVGLLDRSLTGDIMLNTRSRDRQVSGSAVIQYATLPSRVLQERFLDAPMAPGAEVRYQPRDDDQAEILGVVVMAITPES